MPPKVKITREEIVERAIELVREEGVEALNARNIAARLSCSTQPIFSNFKTMEELQDEVLKVAYRRYLLYLENEVKSGKYPRYKSFGMGYIRFAKEEKSLFRLLFMCDRNGEAVSPTEDWEASVRMIMESNGVDRRVAEMIHLKGWVTVHGIATMFATSFLTLDWDLISEILSDAYNGARMKHLSKEEAK